MWNCIRQLKSLTGSLLFQQFTICPHPHRSDVTASIIFTICTELFCNWIFNLSLVSFTVIMTICYYSWNCINTSNSISFHYKWQSRQCQTLSSFTITGRDSIFFLLFFSLKTLMKQLQPHSESLYYWIPDLTLFNASVLLCKVKIAKFYLFWIIIPLALVTVAYRKLMLLLPMTEA